MYNLSADDLEVQARARTFVDEVIPYEEQAEADAGELPPEVVARFESRAAELGLLATNMPAEYGGGGCSMLQQVLIQEQGGAPPTPWAGTSPRRLRGFPRWPPPSRSRST